ncbi:hypothetical protein GCM10027051_10230 [Niabella terrae]
MQIIFLGICCAGFTGLGAQVYIAPDGNDQNPGTEAAPKASLQAAVRQVRELRRLKDPTIATGAHIYVKGGQYTLTEPVFIRPEDSGTESSPLIIENASDSIPEFSGGIRINNWQPLSGDPPGLAEAAKGKLWTASLKNYNGQPPVFRQLWVNDQKAIRARSVNGGEMNRILGWDKQEAAAIIPLPKVMDTDLLEGAEMFIHQWWEIALLRIRKIKISGDSARLYFQEPESRIQNEHPWPAPWISGETGNSAFWLTNALPFLDEPGEWYFDTRRNQLYYWPRPGEDLNQAAVVIPFLETLLEIKGTAETPVQYVEMRGLAFQHANWKRPSLWGHVPHQAGMPMTDAYKLRPAGTPKKASLENQAWITRPRAAVTVNFARHTSFEACQFEHLASVGLDYHRGVQANKITGNLFRDIGGTGIQAGVFSDEGMEIHLPYNPIDKREYCDSLTIANNLLTDLANEDWGAVGIGLGYTRNSSVLHNEISNLGYSGISMGWGWSPAPNIMHNNQIRSNYIHHYGKHNYDCAGIYTLSAQPGSLIQGNRVDSIYKAPYAHLPGHWFYLYTDEGSSGITVKENWTPSKKYLQNNNGPDNHWSDNGPAVADRIRMAAGLEASYQYLTAFRPHDLSRQPVNSQHLELIELVFPKKRHSMLAALQRFLADNQLDPSQVYQWKQHYVILGMMADITVLRSRLQKKFPEATVKPYFDCYYRFDRSRCADRSSLELRDHFVLTANLVADPEKQEQYLADHASQFEKWPEVARGFCQAGFQELLCFRNGRQLMLVISVPRGKTLAELDPKTTENNPRVVDWNRRMAQYQEGIEGTRKGETWVFLEKVKASQY